MLQAADNQPPVLKRSLIGWFQPCMLSLRSVNKVAKLGQLALLCSPLTLRSTTIISINIHHLLGKVWGASQESNLLHLRRHIYISDFSRLWPPLLISTILYSIFFHEPIKPCILKVRCMQKLKYIHIEFHDGVTWLWQQHKPRKQDKIEHFTSTGSLWTQLDEGNDNHADKENI